MHIGVPDKVLPRCATVIPPGAEVDLAALLGASSLTARVMSGPSDLFSYNEMWNEPALLRAEMPSSNLVTDARSLARIYDALIAPGEAALIRRDTLEDACREQASGPDQVILRETTYASGFMLPPNLAPGVGERAFGHPGAGGSMGFADPERELAFAYVTNTMRFDPEGDPRTDALLSALYKTIVN
jgi:CubicO group peptidase (beta-lactamase class C family)